MQIYVSVLGSHPQDIETLMAVGHICEAGQKADDARVFYNRILQIEPWNSDAKQHLDRLNETRKAIQTETGSE
jgi:cytochrome c-type biogenesis protein CcmH/NrfG